MHHWFQASLPATWIEALTPTGWPAETSHLGCSGNSWLGASTPSPAPEGASQGTLQAEASCSWEGTLQQHTSSWAHTTRRQPCLLTLLHVWLQQNPGLLACRTVPGDIVSFRWPACVYMTKPVAGGPKSAVHCKDLMLYFLSSQHNPALAVVDPPQFQIICHCASDSTYASAKMLLAFFSSLMISRFVAISWHNFTLLLYLSLFSVIGVRL